MVNCKICKNTKDCWFAGEDHTKDHCRNYIPTTNSDRLHTMTDELLANWLAIISSSKPQSSPEWLEWLKEEVKE